MKRENRWYLSSVLLLLLSAMTATSLLAVRVSNEANENWRSQSFHQAEQITNIFLGWLDKENETFKGLASLFHGTEDINQEEFAAAIDVIEQTELSIRELSVALVFKSRTGGQVVGLAAGNEDLWQINRHLPQDGPGSSAVNQTVELALNSPQRPVTGPIFTHKNGNIMVVLAFAVPYNDSMGVLMSAVNLVTLIQGIKALHLPPGLHFSLTADNNEQQNFSSASSGKISSKIIASKTLRVKGIDKEWDFTWSTDGSYQGGADNSMAVAILSGGLIISLLLTVLAWLLIKQNEKITEKVIAQTSQLKTAHEQLVQAEKMSSLGSLVAGISHELNTPIGISLTASSSLHSMTEEVKASFSQNGLKKSSLLHYFDQASAAAALIESNINRATRLITSFKQIASDQTSEQRRRFNLGESIDDLLKALAPQFDHNQHTLRVDIPDSLEMDSYPGPLMQILTNFINNSLLHGFTDDSPGQISIIGNRDGRQLILIYTDDGCGIVEEELGKIFDPFYTSKMGTGSSGLGLNLVYNLCTGILDGDIEVSNKPGQGLSFTLRLPLKNRH